MLDFRTGNDSSSHQIRFDISKGEPKLHLDYEIFYKKGSSKKIISHLALNYEDIWDFNENIAIGLLIASAYDAQFDSNIISRIHGIKEALKKNPLAIYPLFVRNMALKPYQWLRENPQAIAVLDKIVANEKLKNDIDVVTELENNGLIIDGEFTVIGNIVYTRIKQKV